MEKKFFFLLVDGDVYLHQEADPRYRGSAIPSRAFRYLQNMTDSGDVTTAAGKHLEAEFLKKIIFFNLYIFALTLTTYPPTLFILYHIAMI